MYEFEEMNVHDCFLRSGAKKVDWTDPLFAYTCKVKTMHMITQVEVHNLVYFCRDMRVEGSPIRAVISTSISAILVQE